MSPARTPISPIRRRFLIFSQPKKISPLANTSQNKQNRKPSQNKQTNTRGQIPQKVAFIWANNKSLYPKMNTRTHLYLGKQQELVPKNEYPMYTQK